MNRYRSYGPLDEAPKPDGDISFEGVDERVQPWQLKPGLVSSSTNKRYRYGSADPRGGSLIMRCMKGDGNTPWTVTYGAAVFSDPNGTDWIVVAADGAIWKTRFPGVAVQMDFPASEPAMSESTFAMFVQCMDVLILLRGEDADPLVLRDINGEWETIPDPTGDGTGTTRIPRSSYGIYQLNRLWLIENRDEIIISDPLNYTRYSAATNQFRINEGNSDSMIAIYPFGKQTMLWLKDQSILRSTQVADDLSDAFTDNLTRKYGCLAPHSLVDTGDDLMWCSNKGIATLGLTIENEADGNTTVLSERMEQTWRRINPLYQHKIQGQYWNGFCYFAVPLDNAVRLSADLIPAAALYNTGGVVVDPITGFDTQYYTLSGLTAGTKYQYRTSSLAAVKLVNGTETSYGDIDFVAEGTSVVLWGVDGDSVPDAASVYEVLEEGTLNGVMVFDTETKQWAGLDEVEDNWVIDVKSWILVNVNGVKQLAYLSGDGFLRLYDVEGAFEDEYQGTVDVPHADVSAIGIPTVTVDTVQVNGGTLVTAQTSQGASSWNCSGSLSAVHAFMFYSSFSYNQSAGGHWTAPNTTPAKIDYGVRFMATNGTLPTVKINGVTITETGAYDWAYVVLISGTQILTQPIEDSFTTRGYIANDPSRKRALRFGLYLSTWFPEYTVTVLSDGVGESEDINNLTNKTYDRTEYSRGRAVDYVETNINDDFYNPFREDYSITFDVSTGTGVTTLEGFNLFDGVNTQQYQEVTESNNIPSPYNFGHYFQLRIANTNGRCSVKMIGLEINDGERSQLPMN